MKKQKTLRDPLIEEFERTQLLEALKGAADMLRTEGTSAKPCEVILESIHRVLEMTADLPISTTNRQGIQPAGSTAQASVFQLSQFTSRPLNWLWPQFIPLGKLTLLDGEAGSGTSLLALTLAAHVSSGRPLPGVPDASAAQGNVLLLAPHDNARDTIKPRLEAAGADLSNVFLLHTVTTETGASAGVAAPAERPFCLAEDLAQLEATIKLLSPILVIIDPLQAALGPVRARSSSRPSPHPRVLLSSLTDLARRTGCAFLLTRSVKIKPSDLRHPRPTGSSDLVSAVRSGLLIACSHDEEQTRVLLSTKSPLCQKPAPLAYQVVEHTPGVPTIHWLEDGKDVVASLLEHGPSRSAQRQSILDYLNRWALPVDAREVADFLKSDYERVRKMMQRMHDDGELVSPYRGFYTTTGHICVEYPFVDLEQYCQERSRSRDHSTRAAVPNVANVPDQAANPNPPPPVAHQKSEIAPVPNVPTAAPPLDKPPSAGSAPASSETTRSNSPTLTPPPYSRPADPLQDRFPSVTIRPKPDDYGDSRW